MKTLKDIHPERVFVSDLQYKILKDSFKKAERDKLYIINTEIAQNLIILDMLKSTDDKNFYIITVDGKVYLEYRKHFNAEKFWNEFRSWFAVITAFAAFIISIIALCLQS